jgi:hypothetical protein
VRRLLLTICLAACAACTNPASPGSSLSGNWSGNLFDPSLGAGTLNFTLAQSGSTVTGTFQEIYASGTLSGSFNGTMNGTSLTGTTTPSVPTACPGNVTATVNAASTQISGTAAVFDCTISDSATFDVAKQSP